MTKLEEIKARLEMPGPGLWGHSGEDIAYLLGEVERLRALLKRLQWMTNSNYDHNYKACISCFGTPSTGHRPECELHQAIKGVSHDQA